MAPQSSQQARRGRTVSRAAPIPRTVRVRPWPCGRSTPAHCGHGIFPASSSGSMRAVSPTTGTNPITNSDPSGLDWDDCDGFWDCTGDLFGDIGSVLPKNMAGGTVAGCIAGAVAGVVGCAPAAVGGLFGGIAKGFINGAWDFFSGDE